MLAIRLQRTGRKGHAQYRVIVQEGHRSPNSGKVVKTLGNYNPHTKEAVIDKDQAQTFLNNGAQPSERIAKILKANGVKLPKWVQVADPIKRTTRNPEKLRRNQPKEESAPVEETPEPKPENVEEKSEEKPAESTESSEPSVKPEEEAKTEDTPEDTATAEKESDSEEKAE